MSKLSKGKEKKELQKKIDDKNYDLFNCFNIHTNIYGATNIVKSIVYVDAVLFSST